MEKIVIVTDHPEEDDSLIACLRMLFPECEIQIFSRHTESLGDATVVQEPETQKHTKLKQ